MSGLLLPAENMALTVARAQVERGENPTPNVSAVLVMALDRLIDELPDGDMFVRKCGPTAACRDGQVLPYPHVEKCFVKVERGSE